ncbi:MAG: transglutaminase domain-containing protein [Pseudonocardia sp.]
MTSRVAEEYPEHPEYSQYLEPGHYLDSDDAAVRAFARDAVGSASGQAQKAARLFVAVRDGFWYDPFSVSNDPAGYRASAIVTGGPTWCVPKAVLLAAAARAEGIPARLGFADVRNHFQTPRLRERMKGADLFVYHGYTDLHVDGRWVKATPAFNTELCARFGVEAIAFDGRADALLHQYTPDGGTYMEYVRDRGVFTDLPLQEILDAFTEVYGAGMFHETAGNGKGPYTDEFTRPGSRA